MKMLLPTPIVIGLSMAAVALFVPPMIQEGVHSLAKETALERVKQFRTVRGIYSRDIVKKVAAHPDFTASPLHIDQANIIPVPATFIHNISEAISQEGLSLKFYSPYPFKNRAGRKLDAFAQKAWVQLINDPKTVVTEESKVNGKTVVRVAVGDTLSQDTCVNCHNSHPLSEKRDWKLGDLRGIFEVTVDVEEIMAMGQKINNKVLQIFIISALFIILASALIGRGIARRLWTMRDTIQVVANGQLDIDIPYVDSHDEVGALGKSLEVFKENARKRIELQNSIKEQNKLLASTIRSYQRFVPKTFIELLGKNDILDVQLGDHTERNMTVLSASIYDFEAHSQAMGPDEKCNFINSYLQRISLFVRTHNGFTDKYTGEGVTALFESADDALAAALQIIDYMDTYNKDKRTGKGLSPIKIGIGLDTGPLIFGTIGEQDRMDRTVISDAVNVSSRIQQLTKTYGAPLLTTSHTFAALYDSSRYQTRPLGVVGVKGKREKVSIFEVIDGASPVDRKGKGKSLRSFSMAMDALNNKDIEAAMTAFHTCLDLYPDDVAVRLILKRYDQQDKLK